MGVHQETVKGVPQIGKKKKRDSKNESFHLCQAGALQRLQKHVLEKRQSLQ